MLLQLLYAYHVNQASIVVESVDNSILQSALQNLSQPTSLVCMCVRTGSESWRDCVVYLALAIKTRVSKFCMASCT